ncbi:Small nuclear ribonucleoprotein Sm D3 [Acropora cervicornis]|uniref:Small nuclear ribonucleoprotein Sm D3 n=1 Tax=Acropora cervicornis TaxID=6130 RepID=A0AAD9VGT5_ACRCE|nr:Small nuclear ribonucleoprotein Sm D3 [Acropora cervicornis]
MSIGVPIKILHEAEGHIVTLETLTGEVYRGKLVEAEDNMNCQMSNITVTARDGRVSQLEQVFIRGSKIRFLILPDMLKNAPMFKKMTQKGTGSGGSAGRGKSAILRAQDRSVASLLVASLPGGEVASYLYSELLLRQGEEEAHQEGAEEAMFSKEEDS